MFNRSETFHLAEAHDGLTLAAALKRLLADQSWSHVRKLIDARRVQVNGNLSLDPERKVRSGDVVKLLAHGLAPPVRAADVKLVYIDEHLVVVQKPAGVTTLRHREETDLPQRRKQLQPTLDELVQQQLAGHLGIRLPDTHTNPKRKRGTSSGDRRRGRGATDNRLQIRSVHRLDRDTSGLMVFARSPEAEQKLIRMFARHAVQRAPARLALCSPLSTDPGSRQRSNPASSNAFVVSTRAAVSLLRPWSLDGRGRPLAALGKIYSEDAALRAITRNV